MIVGRWKWLGQTVQLSTTSPPPLAPTSAETSAELWCSRQTTKPRKSVSASSNWSLMNARHWSTARRNFRMILDDSRWFCVVAVMVNSSTFGMRDGLSSGRGRKSDTKRMRSTRNSSGPGRGRNGPYANTFGGQITADERPILRDTPASIITTFQLLRPFWHRHATSPFPQYRESGLRPRSSLA